MSFYPHVNRGEAFKPNALLENDVRDLVNRLKTSGMPKRIGCAASAFYVQVWNAENTELPAGAAVSIVMDSKLHVVDGALPCRSFTGDYRLFGVLRSELRPGDIGDCVLDGMVEVPITGTAYPGARALPIISDGNKSLMPKFGVAPAGGARVLGIADTGNAIIDLGLDDDYFGLFKVALTYMSGFEGGYSEESHDHDSSETESSSEDYSDSSSFDSPGLDDSSSDTGSGSWGGSGDGSSGGGDSGGSNSSSGGSSSNSESSIDSMEESGFDSDPFGSGLWAITGATARFSWQYYDGTTEEWYDEEWIRFTYDPATGAWSSTASDPYMTTGFTPSVSIDPSTGALYVTMTETLQNGEIGRRVSGSGTPVAGGTTVSASASQTWSGPNEYEIDIEKTTVSISATGARGSNGASSVADSSSSGSGSRSSSSNGNSSNGGDSGGGGGGGGGGNSGDGFSDEPYDDSSESSFDVSSESSESFSDESSESIDSSESASGGHGHSHGGGFVDHGELVLAVYDGADPDAEDCGFADCGDDRIYYPRTVFSNWRRKTDLYVYVSDDQIILSAEYPEPDSDVLRRLLARLIYCNGVYAVVQEQHGPIYEFVCDCSSEESGDGSGSGSSGNHGGGSGSIPGGSGSGSGGWDSGSGSGGGGSGSSSSGGIGDSSSSGWPYSSSEGGSHSASRSKSHSGSRSRSRSGSESSSGYEESGFSWIIGDSSSKSSSESSSSEKME